MITEKWTSAIEEITKVFESKFLPLSSEILYTKLDTQSWSIAENIEHLILINQSYYPILDQVISGTYQPSFLAKISFIPAFLGKSILRSVQPDRRKKLKTLSIWEPHTTMPDPLLLQKFRSQQNELINKIAACESAIENQVIINSPANRHLVYSLETAFDIIVAHEKRHYEQASEVLYFLESGVGSK
ncbi:MAG: DinB family protein [Saprospiraceae bacterium]|nr:DinB family protein [Saprospiraceae bacterium]